MILEQIKVRNYKKLRDFTWEFGRGIKIICGENESGKSTILDAILFALYGVENKKKDDKLVNVISHGAQETWVSLKFSLKGEKYHLLRTIKRVRSRKEDMDEKHRWGDVTFSKILPIGKESPLAAGASEVTEMVKAMLGISVEEILSSNVIAQKEMDRISELQSKEWKDLFNKFLNLDCFTKAIVDTKTELSTKKNEAILAEAKVEVANTARKQYCETLANISKNVKELYIKFKDLRLKTIEERDFNDRFNNLNTHILALEEQAKLIEQLTVLQEKVNDLAIQLAEIEALEAKNADLGKQVATFPDIDVCRDVLKQLRGTFTLIVEVHTTVQQVENELKDLDAKSKALDAARAEFETFKGLDGQIQRFDEFKVQLELLIEKRVTISRLGAHLDEIEVAKENLVDARLRLEDLAGLEPDREIIGKIQDFHARFTTDFESWRVLDQEILGLSNEVRKYQKKTSTVPESSISDLQAMAKTLSTQKQTKFTLRDPSFRQTLRKSIPFLSLGVLTSTLTVLSLFFLIPSLPLIGIGLVYFLKYLFIVLSIESRLSDLEILIESREKLGQKEDEVKNVEDNLEKTWVLVTTEAQSLVLVSFKLESARPIILATRFADELKNVLENLDQLSKRKQVLLERIESLEFFIQDERTLRDTLAEEKQNIAITLNVIELFICEDVPNIITAPSVEGILARVRASDFATEERITLVHTIQAGEDMLTRKRDAILTKINDLEPFVARIPGVKTKLEEQESDLINQLSTFQSFVNTLPEHMASQYVARVYDLSEKRPDINSVNSARGAISNIAEKIDADALAKSTLEAQMALNQRRINEKPVVQKKLEEQQTLERNTKTELNSLQIPGLLPIVKEDITTRGASTLEDQKTLRRLYEETFLDRQAKISNLKQNIREIKGELSSLQGVATRDAAVIDTYFAEKKRKADLDHQVALLSETQRHLETVVADIRAKHIPMIEIFMNHYIERVTSGKYLKVKILAPEGTATTKRFIFMMYDAEAGQYRKKESFSGGTEDQYLLILRLAFAMSLLPSKKGTYPKFIFLDEIFSSSDLRRRNNILDLLQELTSDFEQIFIITHEQDIINDFPDAIRIQDGKIIA